MSEPIEDLKLRLKKALEMRDVKQIELAEKTGLSRAAISQYLSGYTMPKTDRIHKLAVALNVSEAWLMGFDAPMERTELSESISTYINSMEEKSIMERFKKEEYALEIAEGYMRLTDSQKQFLVETLRIQLLRNSTLQQQEPQD